MAGARGRLWGAGDESTRYKKGPRTAFRSLIVRVRVRAESKPKQANANPKWSRPNSRTRMLPSHPTGFLLQQPTTRTPLNSTHWKFTTKHLRHDCHIWYICTKIGRLCALVH
ncbi:hypothetical protein ACLKA6_002764 [Drosophila palustris]